MTIDKKSELIFHLNYLIADDRWGKRMAYHVPAAPEIYERHIGADYIGPTVEGYFLNKNEFEKLGRPEKIVIERTDVINSKAE